jgi:eukaryotic translation initiation factor 2C
MQVLAKEYNAVRAAGLALSENYTPPITYITVLKRHNARLFPGSPDAVDLNGNVKPGVCVDQGITLAHGFDFYLNSHKGIQGTVKPAHYHVLHDENHFGSDAIQIATYWLCYTFCRCTRSVSYCPPAYYAHLVAERGRNLLTGRT